MPIKTAGFAALEAKAELVPFQFEHRDVKEEDVHIKIHWAGVCHSDVSQATAEWAPLGFPANFPMVPGHEIAGIVEAVGSKVTKHKVGDKVGVGCLVDSCRECPPCNNDLQQHCPKAVFTYNGKNYDGTVTQGGYARDIVVNENYVVKIPANLDFKNSAPLLCAGITTYAPMKRYGMDKPGKKIGVIGFGGLGHMAVKFGIAFGNEVTVITRTEAKAKDAVRMGAKVMISTDSEQVAAHQAKFDFLIDTVSAKKDMNLYLNLLSLQGSLVIVGIATEPMETPLIPLLFGMRNITASAIGGMGITQEMLNYCEEKQILPENEFIPMADINKAFARMHKSDIKYRFVIDCSTAPAVE